MTQSVVDSRERAIMYAVMPPRSLTCRGLGRDLLRRSDVSDRICSVPGCGKKHLARDLCGAHYARLTQGGLRPEKPLRIYGDDEARIWSFFHKGAPDECWPWTGPISNGYPVLSLNGSNVRIHRWVFERCVGPIPEGLTIDHTCHNRDSTCVGGALCQHRRCLNYEAHLEAVTLAENIRRAGPKGLGAVNAAVTHCPQGHPYDESNTKMYQGRRYCRACHNADARRHRAHQKAWRA